MRSRSWRWAPRGCWLCVVVAERDLPGLFAKCNQHRIKIRQLKRARDMQGLQQLQPVWSKNIDDINAAIELVTNNEGPRYRELQMKLKRCSGARFSRTTLQPASYLHRHTETSSRAWCPGPRICG